MTEHKIEGGYSEWVVRQACAWTFQSSEFPKIAVNGKNWILTWKGTMDASTMPVLEQNLNEFRLREIIDAQTANLRKKIVMHALESTLIRVKG